jgi:predicted nucleic acid-binding protein
MRVPRIYLDTSVISHLEAPERPDWMAETREMWREIQAGKFDVYISPVDVLELDACPEPKRSILTNWLQSIPYTLLEQTDEVLDLADQYLKAGILPQKSTRDRLHIAYACVYNCDMIVSWNFEHMVNYKTISGVKGANALAGYKDMPIYSPTMLIKGATEDDT